MTAISITWSGRAIGENSRLCTGRGRVYPNPQYQAFVNSMAWEIRASALAAKIGPLEGRLSVRLELEIPTRMDTDAVMKPCLDALQRSGLIANDNQVDRAECVRTGKAKGWRSRITMIAAGV